MQISAILARLSSEFEHVVAMITASCQPCDLAGVCSVLMDAKSRQQDTLLQLPTVLNVVSQPQPQPNRPWLQIRIKLTHHKAPLRFVPGLVHTLKTPYTSLPLTQASHHLSLTTDLITTEAVAEEYSPFPIKTDPNASCVAELAILCTDATIALMRNFLGLVHLKRMVPTLVAPVGSETLDPSIRWNSSPTLGLVLRTQPLLPMSITLSLLVTLPIHTMNTIYGHTSMATHPHLYNHGSDLGVAQLQTAPQNHGSNQASSSSPNQGGLSQAVPAQANVMLASPGVITDPAWYPDSGATNHLTNNAENLNRSQPYTGSGHGNTSSTSGGT